MVVQSSVPGALLIVDQDDDNDNKAESKQHGPQNFPFQSGTVKDVAGSLCDDFENWKRENHLDEIESDWGWFQLTSFAEQDE